MMEGALKNVINFDNTVIVPRKKSRLDVNDKDIELEAFITCGPYYKEGKKYLLTNPDKKPPPPKNNEFDWVWWNGKWIRMYNDVFLPKGTIIPKLIKLANCNYI